MIITLYPYVLLSQSLACFASFDSLISLSHVDLTMEHRPFSMTPKTSLSQDSKILDPGVAIEVGEDVTLLHITAYNLILSKMLLR